MACFTIARVDLAIAADSIRDLLGSKFALEAIKNWLQQRLGAEVTMRQASPDYATFSAVFDQVLRLSVRDGAELMSSAVALATEFEKFLADLQLAVSQQRVVDALSQEALIVADENTALGRVLQLSF